LIKILFASKLLEKRISKRRVQQIFRNIGENVNLRRKLSPHVGRHTYATNRIKKGDRIEEIQVDLGHADLATTAIYAQQPDDEFLSIYHRIKG